MCQTVESLLQNWIKRMQRGAVSEQELDPNFVQCVPALVLQLSHTQGSQNPVLVAGYKSGVCICLLLRNSAGWQRPFLQLSVA